MCRKGTNHVFGVLNDWQHLTIDLCCSYALKRLFIERVLFFNKKKEKTDGRAGRMVKWTLPKETRQFYLIQNKRVLCENIK